MKFLGLLIAGMFSVHTFAATSEMLFPIGGQKFDGAAGNVVFNGTSFVAPTVDGNGALSLTFIDTNAIVISNLSLFITGSAPRVACAGGNYILAWCNTNGAMSVLNCAVISNGVVAPGFVVGTNVARETVSLNADGTNFLAVWQSAQTNGAVLARALSAGGDPNGDTFAVAPSGQSQLYPSVGYDGTNHLVCWMEQNVMSNDWRVIARLISNAVPFSAPVIVSQTNSFRPYPTACTFGSNYLVAWSWDEGPYPSYWIATRDFPQYIQTNVWFPILHGRFVSPSASLIGSTMVIARGMYGNTDPAIAFDGHHYFIAWSTRDTNTVSRYANQRAQSMALDGTARYYPVITAFLLGDPVATRIAFGGDRFCILYKYVFGGGNLSQSVMVGRRAINDFKLINVQRSAGGGIQAQSTGPMQMETSTNFVDWVPGLLSDLPNMPARSQLFVRLVDRRWQCIEQLNAIDWAKHQWAANYRRASTDTPMDQDLFGAGRYLPAKPVCPHGGTYSLNVNGVKPTCTVSGHTM